MPAKINPKLPPFSRPKQLQKYNETKPELMNNKLRIDLNHQE